MALGHPQPYQRANTRKEKFIAPRGRPRIQGITRFNVATDLTGNRKFIRFRRLLGLSELDAYAVLIRFWCYAAANHALDPMIRPGDADILADFCWFEGNPEKLIAALQEAGFVEQDYSVHDWFTHQPLAEKIAKDREYSREKSSVSVISAPKDPPKQREDNLTPIPPTAFPTNGGQWRIDSESSRRNSKCGAATGSKVVAELMSGMSGPFEEFSEAAEISSDFCNRFGYRDKKQRDALTNRIETCGGLHGLDCVRRMIGEIREDPNVREPIAVLLFKLNQAIGKR